MTSFRSQLKNYYKYQAYDLCLNVQTLNMLVFLPPGLSRIPQSSYETKTILRPIDKSTLKTVSWDRQKRIRVRNRGVFPYINNFMRYGSSWVPISTSASQEIPRTLRNQNVHNRVQKGLPLIRSWTMSIHSKPSTLFLAIRFLILS